MMPFDREMLVNALRYNARAIAEGRVYIGMLPYPLCEDIGAVGLVGCHTISLKIDPVSKRKIDSE